MSTATIEQQTASTDEQLSLGQVIEGLDRVHAAAEEILWTLSPGMVPNARERKILRLAGIETRDHMEREVGRVGAVKGWLGKAGSNEEYTAAEKCSCRAVRAEREQRPAIEEQIAALEAQRDELIQAREAATRTREGFSKAREFLREPRLLPMHVKEALEADVFAAGQVYAARIGELQSTLNVIDGLQQIDLNTEQGRRAAQNYCETAAPHCITRTTPPPSNDPRLKDASRMSSVVFHTDSFRSYREERLKERPQIQRELNEQIEMRDAAVAKAERLRDYYIERIK